MINNSFPEFLFIRTCIVGLRTITPLCISWTVIRPFAFPVGQLKLLPLDIYAGLETLFFIAVYLPLRARSQRSIIHPPAASQPDRRTLLTRCVATTSDHMQYLRRWFLDARLEDIKSGNLKEFFAWALLNKSSAREATIVGAHNCVTQDEEKELDEYVQMLETGMSQQLEDGYGSAKSLRLTLDEARMKHRPLVWYLIVFIVDAQTHLWLWWHRFTYYRKPLSRPYPTVLPPRPQTLLSRHVSSTYEFSYWYRPHTSTTHKPILFLHGIGIGLNTYVPFLSSLSTSSASPSGQIGIIALELLPISFRITSSLPRRSDFLSSLQQLLSNHPEFLSGFTVVAHSYGSVLATHIISSSLRPLIHSLVLVDPVSILLHLPDVAYNFTYRSPRKASEWQLWYFASTDMGVAHTLARGFFWSENVMWKEDVSDLRVCVWLAGRDIIAPTGEIKAYLTRVKDGGEGWGRGQWDEEGVSWRSQGQAVEKKVVWCEDVDHAQIFDRKEWRKMLVEEVRSATAVAGDNSVG
ncbi:MAG: hypothetical protein M1820_002185 [Bogoriella megaspora]|nr:MAG: hypothetical protein M1820_002185 [Bogoriella megaspora]